MNGVGFDLVVGRVDRIPSEQDRGRRQNHVVKVLGWVRVVSGRVDNHGCPTGAVDMVAFKLLINQSINQ